MAGSRVGATRGVLALLCLMYFITYIDRVNVSTAADSFKTELGLSNTQVGFVFSAFAYPYLLFQVFGGWLSDRFGARKTLTLCALIWAGATIATGFAGGLVSLVIARFFLGFGEGATFPTATRAMANWVSVEDRGWAQGITHAFSRLGNTITPPLVALLIGLTSWRGSFIVLGCFSFLWVVVWLMYFRDDPRSHPSITQAELDRLPPFGAQKQTPKVPWGPLVARMAPVTIVYFCYGWTLWLFLSWIPSYFLHSYNMKLTSSALFASSVFAAGVLGDSLGGWLSDRILRRTGSVTKARRNMVVIGMVGALCSMLPMLFIHDLTVSVICLSSGFFFAELTIGPMWAIPMDIAPEYSGTASGIMNSGSALAAIVSPVIGGWMIDQTGNWDLPFLCSMMLMLAGAGLAFTMHPEKRFTIPAMA
ncbi:MAG: transporter [Rhodospirillales bacterium]|nr:transporter [Rhodospirillales bacterium]